MQFRMCEARPRWKARTWLRTIALAGFSVLTMAVAAPRAHAICGQLNGAHPSAIKTPMMPAAADDFGAGHYDTIVGLWQTAYSTGGVVFAETFKQWHADGTELDNKDQNPTLGSVCLGVWKPVGVHGVRLHHVGWLFATDGTPVGSFVIDETDTLAGDGMSYQGTFVFKTYDSDGNYSGTTVKGTVAGSRITVN